MNKKNILIISCVAFVLVSFVTTTVAYFRPSVNGDISGNAGSIVFSVNDTTSLDEKFTITLKRSDTENFIIPGDSGYFDLNLNATGSVDSVDATVTIERTGLPNNLKFYIDDSFSNEYTSETYVIKKADTMVRTVRIYWNWKDIDDANDSLFIGTTISANINVSAMLHKPTFVETLIASARNNLDTNVDFNAGSSPTNGIGLMMRDGTQNNEYPILYYRGDVSNNNVIFANLCWLIVRTTDTGGLKLVFNGPVVENADGTESCTNYSGVGGETANTNYTDVYAGNTITEFNTNNKSPVYVGYMYNDDNKFYSKSTGVLDVDGYKAHLADLSTIDGGSGRHTQNKTDSTIKGVIDDWYEENILGEPFESLLEDTVWCNDRSVISETYTIDNYAMNEYFYFAAFTRLDENTTVTPSLVCNRDMDKFTVERSNGNGDLEYPIGMLTADEINLAGHPFYDSQTTYLSLASGGKCWSLSPSDFSDGYAVGFNLYTGRLNAGDVGSIRGARPSVSLGLGATITRGDGSFANPYIVG